MALRTALVIVLSTFAVAVSAVVFFLVWYSLTGQRIEREIVQTRSRVERFISLERWDEAVSLLDQIAQADFSDERSWISFVEQARRIEAETAGIPDSGDNSFEHDEAYTQEFEGLGVRLAEAAVHAVPDSRRLRAVYTLLLLETGREEDAAEHAGLLPDGEFASIHAELWLRGRSERVPAGDSLSANVVRALDEGDFASLAEAWRSTRAEAFGHNAVLKGLAGSERSEAAELLDELPRSENTAELGFLFEVEQALAGQSASIDEAKRWLELVPESAQGSPSILLARADLAALENDRSRRELLLSDALAASPEFSGVMYLGLSRLSADPAEAIGWLRQGLQVRESDTDIAINLAAQLREIGDHEASISVLSRTKEALDDREDERLAFAWILSNPDFGAERRRTALWQLLERFPESETVAAELASRAASAGDGDGLEILRGHTGVQSSTWRYGLDAALAVSRGQTSDAVDAFGEVDPQGWIERYNYALALLSDRRYGSAFRAFEKALEHAKREGASSSDMATIYLRAGETALLRRHRGQARTYAERALEYEPSMVRARLLWRVTGE